MSEDVFSIRSMNISHYVVQNEIFISLGSQKFYLRLKSPVIHIFASSPQYVLCPQQTSYNNLNAIAEELHLLELK